MPIVSLVIVVVVLMIVGPVAAQTTPPLTQVADTPPQVGASMVIAPPGGLCLELVTQFPTVGGARGDLRNRCTELVQNASKPGLERDVQTGLQQMAGVQGVALGATTLTTSLQFTNLIARLQTLRAGGAGIALEEPESLPGPQLASLSGSQVAATAPGGSAGTVPKWGVFLTGAYAFGDVSSTSREAGFDFDAAGVSGGVDYRVTSNLILGLGLGYDKISADFSDNAGTVDVDDFAVSLYGTYYPTEALYVDGIITVALNSYDLERRIVYTIPTVPSVGTGITNVNQTAKAEPDGLTFGVGVAAGYDFTWGALTAGPIGRVNYVRSKVDSYSESINNTDPGFGLALDVPSQTVESLVTGLGGQVSYAISAPIGVFVPQVRFEWVHEYLNNSRTYSAQFVNDPTPSARTTIQWTTDNPDRNFFNVGVGVAATFARGISAFVFYETVLGLDDVTQHRVSGGLRVEF
jgi:outer membrane lipase/esterase